jgi:hypothetical protein
MDWLIGTPKLAILFQIDKCVAWHFRPHIIYNGRKTKDSIIILIKKCFFLALCSTCTTVAFGEGRLRFGIANKKAFLFGTSLNLHYLCPKELKPLINLLFSHRLKA